MFRFSRFAMFVAGAIVVSGTFGQATSPKPEKKEKENRQATLDFNPDLLLPNNTKIKDTKVRLRLEPCKNDNLLEAASLGPGYNLVVGLSFKADGSLVVDPFIWVDGAVHEITSPITLGGYNFEPVKGSVLTFTVEAKKGYVYQSGTGKVHVLAEKTNANDVSKVKKKETIELTPEKKGTVFGKPTKQSEKRDS